MMRFAGKFLKWGFGELVKNIPLGEDAGKVFEKLTGVKLKDATPTERFLIALCQKQGEKLSELECRIQRIEESKYD